MSVVKRLGFLSLLVLLLVVALVAWLTMTESGLHRLLSMGHQSTNGNLTVRKSTGALVGPAQLVDIQFADANGLSVAVDEVRLNWSPRQLIRRTFQLEELVVHGITVKLPPPTESETGGEALQLNDFALPFSADVKNVRITDLKVYPYGAEAPFVLDSITVDASGRDNSVKLIRLSVDGPTFMFGMDGTLNMEDSWPIELNPEWTFTHQDFGEFSGRGTLAGDMDELNVLHKISGAASADIDIVLNDVTSDIGWEGNILAGIEDLGTIAEGANGVPLKLQLQTKGSQASYSAIGSVHSGHPLVGATSTTFDLQGDLTEVVINESVTTIDGSALKLSIDGATQFDNLQSEVAIVWTDLQWPLLADDSSPVALAPSGQFTITGTPSDLLVSGDAEVTTEQSGLLDLSVDAGVKSDEISIDKLLISPRTAKTDTLSISGEYNLNEQFASLSASVSDFNWPLTANNTTPAVEVTSGSLTLEGPIDSYKLTLDAEVTGVDIPSGTWSIEADGSQTAFSRFSIDGETLNGTIVGNGKLAWQPTAEWNINVEIDGIDPSVKWPGLKGDVDLQLETAGLLTSEGLRAENRITKLAGSYQQQPLSGSGLVLIDGDNLLIDTLAVRVGDAAVVAEGELSDELNLDWALEIPDINKLSPSTSGDIKVKGNLMGTREQPVADFSVAAANVSTAGVRIGTANGSGKIDVGGGEQSAVEVRLKDVVSGGQVFDIVEIDGAGTPEKHSAKLSFVSAIVNADLTVAGGLVNGRWIGEIDSLNVANPDAGDWTLADAAPLELSAAVVKLSAMCLQSAPSELCLDSFRSGKDGAVAEVTLDALDTGRFAAYLPPDLSIDAMINGEATLSTRPGGSPVVVADIQIPGGKMTYLDGGEVGTSILGTSRVQFEYRDDNVNSSVDLDLGSDIGTLKAKTTVRRLSGARTVDGVLQTDIKDISPFSSFAPGLDSFEGALKTNMELAGSLDKPRITGETELDALALEVPAVAMKLTGGKITAKSDGSGGFVLSGRAESGGGEIKLEGYYNPAAKELDASIKGENFRVANASRQRAEISPDIRVVMEGDETKVSGLLHVPSAFIDTAGSSGLVAESADVVLVNSEAEAGETPTSLVSVDVRVTLGEDITVKAGQFSGALAGELLVEQTPGAVPTGVGAIEVVSGDFIVYGQKLIMEQGRIIFGGGPITNPALEFDVAREVPAYDVKAGAQIRGTAQAPILQLQSEPAQTDANTLSFILLGTPVSERGASYTLGRYITPDLYVSYARDLFTQVQTFSVRYRINNRLTLVATSSESVSGSDLVYTFER